MRKQNRFPNQSTANINADFYLTKENDGGRVLYQFGQLLGLQQNVGDGSSDFRLTNLVREAVAAFVGPAQALLVAIEQ